jgi:hypothetical protein
VGYIRGWGKFSPTLDSHWPRLTTLPGGRSVPQVDILFTYVLQGPRPVIDKLPVCKDNQRYPVNNPDYPRLKARPGAQVTSSHFENGHVTLPQVADGFSGFTYWLGTRSPDPTTFGEVVAWTADGKGGNGQGSLIGVNHYDDGACAESNNTPLSAQRGVGVGKDNKACKGYFVLPADLKPGDTYTVYWVWDFSWHFGISERREEVSILFPPRL